MSCKIEDSCHVSNTQKKKKSNTPPPPWTIAINCFETCGGVAALNSKVSIYLLESNFYLKKTFFNYKKVREVDVVIVEKALEWKDNQDDLLTRRSVLLW